MDAEEPAPDAPASTSEPPKRRGRPKGLPKTGGRQALPKTPADLRAFITAEIGKAEHLLEIATGAEIHMSGPTGKSFLGRASIPDRLAAWRMLLGKVMPDLQTVSIDAKLDGEIRTPDAPPTRDLARAVLDILRTAQMEKIPHRGEYVEADESDDEDEPEDGSYFNQSSAELASRGSAESAGGVVEPPSAPANAAPGQPFPAARNEGDGGGHAPSSPSPFSADEIKARLREHGVPFNDGPMGVPFNPDARRDEMPPAMSAEAKMRERQREQNNKHRDLCGLPRVAPDGWMAETAGIPEGPHERRPGQYEVRPGAPGSEFNSFGYAQPIFIGDRGHFIQRDSLQNGDGRRRYSVHGRDGMRLAFVWSREAAEAKIHELIEQEPRGAAEAKQPMKWQR